MADSFERRSFPTIAPNALDLPYPVRPRGLAFWGALVSYIVFGLAAVVPMGVTLAAPAGKDEWWVVLVFLGISGFCIYGLWGLYRPRTVLYPDRVEQRGLLGGMKILHRNGVAGVGRDIYSRSGSYFDIMPNSLNDPTIRLSASVRKDSVVAAWLAGAPNPDAERLAADRAAVLSDERFGATEAERSAALNRAKPAATVFTVVFVGAAYAAFIFSAFDSRLFDGLAVVAAAIAPLIAFGLVRWSKGLIVWLGVNRAQPQVGIGAIAPAIALGVATAPHNTLYDIWLLAGAAAMLGLGLAAVIYFNSHPQTATVPTAALFAGVAAGCGLFGAVVTADTLLDNVKPKTYAVTVLDAHKNSGKSTSYYLSLPAWPHRAAGDVQVDYDLYHAVVIGDQVCVSDHKGALDFGWFEVAACQGRMPRQALSPGSNAPQSQADRLSSYYPERAQRLEKEGSAVVTCDVSADLALSHCRALSESPEGYGFGEAAVRMLTNGEVKPQQLSLKGRKTFQTRIRFKLDN